MTTATHDLPPIPVLDVGADFPMATLLADQPRAHALMDAATRRVPPAVLRGLDVVSRRWLRMHGNAHLDEIDAIARQIARPGVHFLAVNYEWGCTVGVGPAPDGNPAAQPVGAGMVFCGRTERASGCRIGASQCIFQR